MDRKEPYIIALILLLYTGLAWSYAYGPLFEAPDEALHYEYARVVADERILPDPYTRTWSQFPQPPLFYLLMAPILMINPDQHFWGKYGANLYSPFPDSAPAPGRAWGNPYFGKLSRNTIQQNKNQLLHARSEAFPYVEDETARAAHLLRLASIGLGALTLLCSYQIFRVLWENDFTQRILALGFVAFFPLFQRTSASITNDNLAILLSTISLYLLVQQQKSGWSLRWSGVLGVVLGLALSTKLLTAVLAIPVGISILMERRSWRFAPLILALALFLGGGWYLRNQIVYGNYAFLDHPQIASTSLRPDNQFVLDHALATFPDILSNMWARFDIILVHRALENTFQFMLLIAGIGLFYETTRFLVKRKQQGWTPEHLLTLRQSILIMSFVFSFFLFIFYMSGVQTYGVQGRYALNVLPGMAVMASLGWLAWFRGRIKALIALSAVCILAALAVIIFTGYFRLAYQVLPISHEIVHRVNFRYDSAAQLLGTSTSRLEGQPGQQVEIILYWEAIAPTDTKDVVVYLGALDSGMRVHSYPAGGNLLASDWEPSEQWREHYFIEIPASTRTQRTYPLVAGLYQVSDAYTFLAYNDTGEETFPVIGQLVIHGEPRTDPQYTYRFGDVIGLENPTLQREGDQIELCLDWVALASPEVDYHYFVHVYQGDERYQQVDGQPRAGEYPTNVWLKGEIIQDCIIINAEGLDTETWSIQLGLYDFGSGVRLPVRDENGVGLPNDQLPLYPAE